MPRILKENENRFKVVEQSTGNVIEAITNTGLRYEESEMKVDVCEAIKKMREESERKGELLGEQKGELKKSTRICQKFLQFRS